MPVKGAGQQIFEAVTGWDEIAHAPHRFGGTEFRVGHREVGHVHGDSLVDIPFSLHVRDELVKSGEAEPHHILPKSAGPAFFFGIQTMSAVLFGFCGSPTRLRLRRRRETPNQHKTPVTLLVSTRSDSRGSFPL